MTGEGGLVEVQATAERTPLSRAHLDELLALAAAGIEQLRAAQEQAIARGRVRRVSGARQSREAAAGDAQRAQAARVRAAAPDRAGGERGAAVAAGGGRLPPEDGETFAENALGKARAAAAGDRPREHRRRLGHRGGGARRRARACARRATRASTRRDEENLDKLLREAPAGSALRYVCAIAYVDPARGVERIFEGRCAGRLAHEPRGERGFGYDPAFLPDDGPPG